MRDNSLEHKMQSTEKILDTIDNLKQEFEQLQCLLLETTKNLEYSLFELWEVQHSHMTDEQFDEEYKDLQQAAKKANDYLILQGLS